MTDSMDISSQSVHDVTESKDLFKDPMIYLHPLAIISITDHFTRVTSGGGVPDKNDKVIGLLFGQRNGSGINISDASDVCYSVEQGILVVSQQSVEKQRQLYTAVYPDYEIIGWYSIGSEPSEADLLIQSQISNYCSNPILLMLNSDFPSNSKYLPIAIYSGEALPASELNKGAIVFVQINFQLHMESAEKIGVEHVVRSIPSKGSNIVEAQSLKLSSSLQALLTRICTIQNYLREVQKGKIQVECGILRQIQAISSELSCSKGGVVFEDIKNRDQIDHLIMTHLSGIQTNVALMESIANYKAEIQ